MYRPQFIGRIDPCHIDLGDIMAVLSEADLKTAESGVRMVVKQLGLRAVLLGPLRAHFRRR